MVKIKPNFELSFNATDTVTVRFDVYDYEFKENDQIHLHIYNEKELIVNKSLNVETGFKYFYLELSSDETKLFEPGEYTYSICIKLQYAKEVVVDHKKLIVNKGC